MKTKVKKRKYKKQKRLSAAKEAALPREIIPVTEEDTGGVVYMWWASLVQIIHDCKSNNAQVKKELEEWLDSEDFLEYCTLIEFDPIKVRRGIRDIMSGRLEVPPICMSSFIKVGKDKQPKNREADRRNLQKLQLVVSQ